MNESSEKNITSNPDSQNGNITNDQLQNDSQQPQRRSASSGPLDMQFATAMDRVTVPTPEAAKMARYADFPVSPSLGTADISIPIYEINTGRLRLPISLQYSTSGIKVTEISGPVGLGWHLNAGGVITRSVCGVPDGTTGYLPIRGKVTSSVDRIDYGTDQTMSRYASGESDGQLDRYSYNFMGHTGSFVILGGMVIMPLTPTDLRFEMPSLHGIRFRITDASGTVYDFGEEETSARGVTSASPTPLAPSNTCGMGYPNTTATSWYLKNITSMDGLDSISLEYDSDEDVQRDNHFITVRDSFHKTYIFSYKYHDGYGQDSWRWKSVQGQTGVQYESGFTPDIASSDWRYETSDHFSPRMLRKITFRGGSVVFAYESNGITPNNLVRRSYRTHLVSVKVRTTGGETRMEAALGYRNTGASDMRELLESVTFKGADGSVYDSRKMTYYSPETVMGSNEQDLFGYYNGASGNTTLVPFSLFPDTYTINEQHGDRTYRPYLAKCLSLKSVTTGSGAYTEIQYEGNSVPAPSTSVLTTIGIGIRVSRIITGNRTAPEGRETWTEAEEIVHDVRIRTFTYSDPVLTIPAELFTHNRFITASESCCSVDGTRYGHWEGWYSPERTCNVTIGDQSVHGGAPLESAMIVYGKVSEKVSDPDGDTWHRTEYTFDAQACAKGLEDRLWDVTETPESHDSDYSGNGFHHFQRIPPRVTRHNLCPSVDIAPPEFLFKEGNCPMMTQPTMTRKFIRKAGEAYERIIEVTRTSYESASREVQTGYSVRRLISVNTTGWQDNMYMCLSDYKQTVFMTRVILSREVSSETFTYRDGTVASSYGSSAVIRATRTRYSYEGSERLNETSPVIFHARVPLDSVPVIMYTLSPRTVETVGMRFMGMSGDREVWEEDDSCRITRHMVFPDEFVESSLRPEGISALMDKGYRLPVGEEIYHGEMSASTEVDSRYVSFRNFATGEQNDTNSVLHLLPYCQRTYRNRVNVHGGTDGDYDYAVTSYDSKGNPIEVREPGKPVRSYIWGYEGAYPIAEIVGMKTGREDGDGADIHAVEDYLSPVGRESALNSTAVPISVATAMEQMRSLSGVTLVSMSMKPLVGLESEKDPAGRTTRYSYDPAGRLIEQRRIGSGGIWPGDIVADWSYDFMRTDGMTNSITCRTYTEEGSDSTSARTGVTRLDGMGRTVQRSLLWASPYGGDIVTPYESDFLDREDSISYLPYRETFHVGGDYLSGALTRQKSFYTATYGEVEGERAFTRKFYEPSQRNKVEATSLPGHDPNSIKTVMTVEGIGISEVIRIRTDATAEADASNIIRDGYWAAGSLVKTTTAGPDGSVTQVFTNAFGSTVLERRLISGSMDNNSESSPVWSSTYYVRDLRDRVECVVTPDEYDALVSDSSTSRSADKCYVYRYDNLDRVTYRKIPQRTPTVIEYDEAGRVTRETTGSRIFSNDYDSLGRLVSRKYRYVTGAQRTLMEYGYDYYPASLVQDGLTFCAVPGTVTGCSSSVKGLKTWERVRVLSPTERDSALAADSSATYVSRAFYYDKYGRLVQTVERNHLGQVSRISVEYDFVGNVISTRETQSADTGSSSSASADTSMAYDREGRITAMSVTLSPVTATASYGYDDIGRPVTRTLGSASSPAAVITDLYTIQGWLSQRNSTQFTSQLRYENPAHGTAAGPGLAGNITEWKTFRNRSTANGSTYAFTYDLMSRLKSSSRYAGNSATATNPYTEKDIIYFADSRIKTMKRYGASASSVQDLSFATDSNTYDAYRNVTNDASSGTTIEWNILNLPRKMTTSGGIVSEYTYLADGTKIRMKSGTTTWHYLGSMVFSQAGSASPMFESMAFSEGRIVVNSSGSKEVHYHITDHLGSVRSVVKADGTVIAANDYYPYGKRINTASSTTPTQKDRHTFSGKEDQALTPGGAPYLDFGARMYSAETGRWLSVDPMAEKFYGIGTHMYCAGNPIVYIDENGKSVKVKKNDDGTYETLGGEFDDDLNIYEYSQDENGDYTIKGDSIGISATPYSFYDTDDGKGWQIGRVIDPKDKSGIYFLSKMSNMEGTLGLVIYMILALPHNPFDFKFTNGKITKLELDIYRGMPIGIENGRIVYASARDVGNMAAGRVAATHNIPWGAARMAFDALEYLQHLKFVKEGESTQAAQRYGYNHR